MQASPHTCILGNPIYTCADPQCQRLSASAATSDYLAEAPKTSFSREHYEVCIVRGRSCRNWHAGSVRARCLLPSLAVSTRPCSTKISYYPILDAFRGFVLSAIFFGGRLINQTKRGVNSIFQSCRSKHSMVLI